MNAKIHHQVLLPFLGWTSKVHPHTHTYKHILDATSPMWISTIHKSSMNGQCEFHVFTNHGWSVDVNTTTYSQSWMKRWYEYHHLFPIMDEGLMWIPPTTYEGLANWTIMWMIPHILIMPSWREKAHHHKYLIHKDTGPFIKIVYTSYVGWKISSKDIFQTNFFVFFFCCVGLFRANLKHTSLY
jgi:hypothetical protein